MGVLREYLIRADQRVISGGGGAIGEPRGFIGIAEIVGGICGGDVEAWVALLEQQQFSTATKLGFTG